jgi:hypothetical protein
VGDADDEDLLWTIRAQLAGTCVEVYLHGTQVAPTFASCASAMEFTYPAEHFCEPLE